MTEAFKEECKNGAYKNRLGKVEFSDETFTNSDTLSSIEFTDSCVTNDNIIGSTNNKTLTFNNLGTKNLIDKELEASVGISTINEESTPFPYYNKTISGVTVTLTEKGILTINGKLAVPPGEIITAIFNIDIPSQYEFDDIFNLYFEHKDGSIKGSFDFFWYSVSETGSSVYTKIVLKDQDTSSLINTKGNKNSQRIRIHISSTCSCDNLTYSLYINKKPIEEDYLSLGKFIVTDEEISDTLINGKYTCSDLGYKLDEVYECTIKDFANATIKDFYIDACNQAGLTPTQQTFTNFDIPVSGNPFTNRETIRTVISNIAQAGCYFVKTKGNQITLSWFDSNVSEIFDKSQYSTLNKNQQFGPVNCIVIGESSIDGNNYTKEDQQSITENGETQISILDNYFLNTDELRKKAMDGIYNKLNGFKYVNYELISHTGKPYLEKGNKISIEDMDGNYFDTYVLNHTFTYDGTFKSNLSASSLSTTQQAIKNTQSITNVFRRTQRLIDRTNGVIEDVVEEQNETNKKISQVVRDIDGVNSKVETLEHIDVAMAVDGANIITNGAIKGNAIEYIVYGTKFGINFISSIYVFDNDEKYKEYKYSLDLRKYPLYKLENVSDSLNITKGKLIKRIGIDDNDKLYLLEKEEEYDVTPLGFELNEDINYVYFNGDDAGDSLLKYKSKNITDEMYVTGTQLIQNDKEVKAEVYAKVGENYATKGELSLKVGKNENNQIVSMLNGAADEITFAGGTKINLTTAGKLLISAGNFKIDTNGTVTCENAVMNNITINSGQVNLKGKSGEAKVYLYNDESGYRFNNSISSSGIRIVDEESGYENGMSGSVITIGKSGYSGQRVEIYGAGLLFVYGSSNYHPSIITESTMRTATYENWSTESSKKDFEKFNDGLGLIKEADIYKYRYKSQNETDRKKVGLVIPDLGGDYKTPKEVISNDGQSIDLYSMIGVAWSAIKQLDKENAELREEIKKIKEVVKDD